MIVQTMAVKLGHLRHKLNSLQHLQTHTEEEYDMKAVCIYKMHFASCSTVNCPHFDLEEADCWSNSAWKFEAFQVLKASVLIFLEHDISGTYL